MKCRFGPVLLSYSDELTRYDFGWTLLVTLVSITEATFPITFWLKITNAKTYIKKSNVVLSSYLGFQIYREPTKT